MEIKNKKDEKKKIETKTVFVFFSCLSIFFTFKILEEVCFHFLLFLFFKIFFLLLLIQEEEF
jgi:hypothetical protein